MLFVFMNFGEIESRYTSVLKVKNRSIQLVYLLFGEIYQTVTRLLFCESGFVGV